MERKNPAGMASNPAYFIDFPFSAVQCRQRPKLWEMPG
jgi:hypothetical protein